MRNGLTRRFFNLRSTKRSRVNKETETGGNERAMRGPLGRGIRRPARDPPRTRSLLPSRAPKPSVGAPRGHGLVADTGAVTGRNGETWRSLDMAIRQGRRGLTGGSLAKLPDEQVGPRPVAGRGAPAAGRGPARGGPDPGRTGAYPPRPRRPPAGRPPPGAGPPPPRPRPGRP